MEVGEDFQEVKEDTDFPGSIWKISRYFIVWCSCSGIQRLEENTEINWARKLDHNIEKDI